MGCELGQSTLEFALTLLLLMAFVLFYIQLALMMGVGNYVHYATFMSARAYMAAGPSRENQVERARAVIGKMVKRSEGSGADRFPSILKGTGGGEPNGFQVDPPGQFRAEERNSSWMEGVRYTFKSRLFVLPFGKGARTGGDVNSLTLTSESWLGREPAYDECQDEMGRMLGIFDNGC